MDWLYFLHPATEYDMQTTHDLSCPYCARAYSVTTEHAVTPIAQPCGPCWRIMDSTEKAEWVGRMRSAEPAKRSLHHRDPMEHAPATLKAYVHHLESLLAAQRGE